MRKRVSGNHEHEWLLWCLGSALFANVVASFGINYMVQIEMALFAMLACISVATISANRAADRKLDSTGGLPLASAPRMTGNYFPLREIR